MRWRATRRQQCRSVRRRRRTPARRGAADVSTRDTQRLLATPSTRLKQHAGVPAVQQCLDDATQAKQRVAVSAQRAAASVVRHARSAAQAQRGALGVQRRCELVPGRTAQRTTRVKHQHALNAASSAHARSCGGQRGQERRAMCCACHVIGAPRRRRRYAFQLLVPFLWLYNLGGREMRAVARAAARRACAGDASAARLLSASAASLQSSAAPPRDAPANLELHRWAEGLKYGVPKFSGLATFFRQPFSPTLEGARPAAHAQRAAPMRSRLPAPRGARYHCPCGASRRAASAAALRCCRRCNPFLWCRLLARPGRGAGGHPVRRRRQPPGHAPGTARDQKQKLHCQTVSASRSPHGGVCRSAER